LALLDALHYHSRDPQRDPLPFPSWVLVAANLDAGFVFKPALNRIRRVLPHGRNLRDGERIQGTVVYEGLGLRYFPFGGGRGLLRVNGMNAQAAVPDTQIAICDHCHQFSIWIKKVMEYPVLRATPSPHPDMPANILPDYEEARSVFGEGIVTLHKWSSEMDDCRTVDPANALKYYNTEVEVSVAASLRETHFLIRQNLIEQFYKEDDEALR